MVAERCVARRPGTGSGLQASSSAPGLRPTVLIDPPWRGCHSGPPTTDHGELTAAIGSGRDDPSIDGDNQAASALRSGVSRDVRASDSGGGVARATAARDEGEDEVARLHVLGDQHGPASRRPHVV